MMVKPLFFARKKSNKTGVKKMEFFTLNRGASIKIFRALSDFLRALLANGNGVFPRMPAEIFAKTPRDITLFSARFSKRKIPPRKSRRECPKAYPFGRPKCLPASRETPRLSSRRQFLHKPIQSAPMRLPSP